MRTLRGRSMKLNLLLEDKREEILRIAAEHGAREVRIFGSAGRPMGRVM
jgi:predicted nucleotidyltransferase